MSETEPSAACINEFNDFEECVIEGFINNTPLFQEFVDAYKASEDCFENAADEAAVAICEEPLWVISAQACPSGIDPLIAACDDDETHSKKFALGVFEKIAKDSAAISSLAGNADAVDGKRNASDMYTVYPFARCSITMFIASLLTRPFSFTHLCSLSLNFSSSCYV